MPLNRIASAGLLLAVGACTSVKPVQPAEFIPQHNPAVVWVTYTDQSYVPVAQPHVVGDTLKGVWQGLNEPLTIPFNEIQTVQARQPSPKRTIMLFTTLGVVGGAVIYTYITAGNGGKPALYCLDHNGQPTNECSDNPY